MKKPLRITLCCLSLIGVLIALLGSAVSVRADDGGPVVPEPPVATEEPIDLVATESPITESTIPEVKVSVEETVAQDEAPAESPLTLIPTESTVPEVKVSAEETVAQEETPAESLLTLIPDGTDVQVLDESGLPEPLASQEAVDTFLTGDPIWCPAGVAPVANTDGCTASYTSFESLLLYLSANQPNQAGVIWIEKGYDSSVNDQPVTSFTLDGSVNFLTMKYYELTIQGGWNGNSAGTIANNDPSEFNATLNILNWNGNVTLNNLLFTEANGPGMNFAPSGFAPSTRGAGLAITTTGDVTLNDVDATKNNSSGVLIDNRSGSGTVSISRGNFDENGTGVFGGLGIYVVSNGEITVNSVTANGNRWEGADFFNDTLASPSSNITLTGTNTFNNNGHEGLMLSSMGDINLNNITVNGNGLTGAYIYNASGNDNVTFSGNNTFSNNVGAGMYVYCDGIITIHNVTAMGNGAEGAVLLNGVYHTSNKIVFTGTNIFHGNGGSYPDLYYDLYIGLDRDVVQYRNVATHGKVVLEFVNMEQLPGGLPDGTIFISGLQAMETGDEVVITFPIPSDLLEADFSILYWDGSQWLDLETAVFEDGRLIIDSGHKTGNGYFQATVNFGGIFVLTQKISQ